jgi:hypothetical protein
VAEAAAEAIAIASQTRLNAWETFMSQNSVDGEKRRCQAAPVEILAFQGTAWGPSMSA